jgi:predicted HicB family RNase H-like nuclease
MNQTLQIEIEKALQEQDRDSLVKEIRKLYRKKTGRKVGIGGVAMSVNMTIRLPKTVKHELKEEALRKGVKLSRLIRERLSV